MVKILSYVNMSEGKVNFPVQKNPRRVGARPQIAKFREHIITDDTKWQRYDNANYSDFIMHEFNGLSPKLKNLTPNEKGVESSNKKTP